MKKTKLWGALTVLGLLAFAAQAQLLLPPTNIVNIALVGQVQQDPVHGAPSGKITFLDIARTTNLTINTRSLLALIAADQGFTLPPKAKLGLVYAFAPVFVVLNQDNTVFTNVDSELLSLVHVMNVYNFTFFQTTNSSVSTGIETSEVTLGYNGSSISFTLNGYRKEIFRSQSDYINVAESRSFSIRGFGSGTCNGQNMIITGSLNGKEARLYPVNNVGSFPPPSNPSGAFPGSGAPLPSFPGSRAP